MPTARDLFGACRPSDVEPLRGYVWDTWLPWPMEDTVLVLNQFELLDAKGVQPISWSRAARLVEVDLGRVARGYPSADAIMGAAPAGILSAPAQGSADVASKQAVVSAVRATHRVAQGFVGLYLGWGVPADVEVDPTHLVIDRLPFGFLDADLGQALDAWALDDLTTDTTHWTRSVAFAWPSDRSWFVAINPDSAFVAVSGASDLCRRLSQDPTVETWWADGRHTDGQHRPTRPTD